MKVLILSIALVIIAVCSAEREYLFVKTSLSWRDAEKYCNRWGGHLVTVTSFDNQQYLKGEIRARQLTGTWIGYNDGQWADHADVDNRYTYWAPGQPSGGTGKNCAVIQYDPGMWEWHVTRCTMQNDFICQRRNGGPTAQPGSTHHHGHHTRPHPTHHHGNHTRPHPTHHHGHHTRPHPTHHHGHRTHHHGHHTSEPPRPTHHHGHHTRPHPTRRHPTHHHGHRTRRHPTHHHGRHSSDPVPWTPYTTTRPRHGVDRAVNAVNARKALRAINAKGARASLNAKFAGRAALARNASQALIAKHAINATNARAAVNAKYALKALNAKYAMFARHAAHLGGTFPPMPADAFDKTGNWIAKFFDRGERESRQEMDKERRNGHRMDLQRKKRRRQFVALNARNAINAVNAYGTKESINARGARVAGRAAFARGALVAGLAKNARFAKLAHNALRAWQAKNALYAHWALNAEYAKHLFTLKPTTGRPAPVTTGRPAPVTTGRPAPVTTGGPIIIIPETHPSVEDE